MVLGLSWSILMTKVKFSLPQRISYLVVGLAFTITMIYSAFVTVYAWMIEDNIFNRQIAAEVEFIKQEFTKTAQVVKPRSGFMTLHANWYQVPEFIVTGYQADQQKIEYTTDNDTTFHINVFELDNTEYVLVADVASFEVSRDFLPGLLKWLLLLSVLSCFVVSLIAFIIVKWMLNPIKQLAEEVENLTAEQVNEGFSDCYPNNEVKTLAQVIEMSFNQLQLMLAREVNFTRDVSHEIRTPISILKNIVRHKTESDIGAKELAAINQVSFELEQTTNTLLALARNESQKLESINMAEVVENALLSHFELNHSDKGKAIAFDLYLAETVNLQVNKNLVQILINNILSNIVAYSSDSKVAIRLSQTQLQFINSTEHQLPEQMGRAGVKGGESRGIGQGLNLIDRICKANRWQMHTHYKKPLFTLTINFE